jgi:hypothetical protein
MESKATQVSFLFAHLDFWVASAYLLNSYGYFVGDLCVGVFQRLKPDAIPIFYGFWGAQGIVFGTYYTYHTHNMDTHAHTQVCSAGEKPNSPTRLFFRIFAEKSGTPSATSSIAHKVC